MRNPSLVVMVLAAAACGTSLTYLPTNASPRPMRPRPVETVDVYTVSLPSRPFVEVAILEAQQESELSLDAPPEVLIKLRRLAAERGCDAMIVSGRNDSVVGHGGRRHVHVTTLHGYSAACVMYDDARMSER